MVHLLWQEGQLEELAVLEVALRTWGNGLMAAKASGGVAAELALEQSALRRQRVAEVGLVPPRALTVAVLLVLEGEPELVVKHRLTRLVGAHSIRRTEPLLIFHAQKVGWFLHLDCLFSLFGDVIWLIININDIFKLHIKTLFLTKIRSTFYGALKIFGLYGWFFGPSGFWYAWLGQNHRSFTSFWCLILFWIWQLWIKELVLLDCWDGIFDIICTHDSIARWNYLWWYICSIIIISILSIKINIWAPLLIWLCPFGFRMIVIHRSYHWQFAFLAGAFTTDIWVASIHGTLLVII